MFRQLIVTNKRMPDVKGYTTLYIGRGGPWGNPEPMRGEKDRQRVIDLYREHLRADWRACGPLRSLLESLADSIEAGECIALQCFCAPYACHGDVIREAVEGIIKRRKQACNSNCST